MSLNNLAVFLFVAIESTGVPVPGEAMLMVASAYAGTTHRLAGALVIACAALGAIAGDNMGYSIGRVGGYRLLTRYGGHVRLDPRRLRTSAYLFEQHAGKVVFFGRFVGVLRIWAAFLAGVHRMPWQSFLLCNAAGGVLWASFVGSIAYTLGARVLRYGGLAGALTTLVATAVMAGISVSLRRKGRRFERELESRPVVPIVVDCTAA